MSNVIKSNRYVPAEEARVVELFHLRTTVSEGAVEPQVDDSYSTVHAEREQAANRLLTDAKQAAEEQLQLASEEASRLLREANEQIEAWWDERRLHDLQVVEESRESGYQAGYQEGLQLAQQEVAQHYEGLLEEAKQLVEEAHRVKERVISESEPFLVDLAAAIAKKIVGEHIAADPDWTIRHVKRTLERRKEKGLVTLCVAPSQFVKMQDARSELTLAIDSQAELQIVPDGTVEEGGCVVRSAFGSIDARIDTQLSELKSVLMEVAERSDEGGLR